jgi:hypothetical protein
MIRTLPVSAGILAIACFATERMIFCYAPNAPLTDNLLWLQYGFFIWFFVQIIFTSLSFLKQPDHHLDGLTLTAMLTTIVLFIVSIPLYNVILRLCNFIVELADHVLP